MDKKAFTHPHADYQTVTQSWHFFALPARYCHSFIHTNPVSRDAMYCVPALFPLVVWICNPKKNRMLSNYIDFGRFTSKKTSLAAAPYRPYRPYRPYTSLRAQQSNL